MADIVVSQQVTQEEVVEAYNLGASIQSLADKHGIPMTTINDIVSKAFPQDVDGSDVPVLTEGVNPEPVVASTETVAEPVAEQVVTSTKNTKV